MENEVIESENELQVSYSVFNYLPDEMILAITVYLNDNDLKNFMLVSKRMYYLLYPEFEKTKTFGKYLHNFFLAFFISNNENCDALHNSDYGTRFDIKKYCDFEKLQKSIFVISRIGNLWSWRTMPFGDGKYKKITCQCESEYCPKNDFIVDINLRSHLLNIAIKQDMWSVFLKERPGFKKAFELIKHDLIKKENDFLIKQLKNF
jgi:hypothetical protein